MVAQDGTPPEKGGRYWLSASRATWTNETVQDVMDGMIPPVRVWLRFCLRHRLPWWLACAGVEAGLAVTFLTLFIGLAALFSRHAAG